jgi:hypothetical protein
VIVSLFGLATAFPVGVQSFMVMNQGLRFGYPRVLFGIVTATLCDTLLIVAGAAGASVLVADADEWVPVLLIGIAFLAIFGVLAFRSPPEEEAEEVNSVGRLFPMIAQTVGVSLFNPYVVLEMVGVLGGHSGPDCREPYRVRPGCDSGLVGVVPHGGLRRLGAPEAAHSGGEAVDAARLRGDDAGPGSGPGHQACLGWAALGGCSREALHATRALQHFRLVWPIALFG